MILRVYTQVVDANEGKHANEKEEEVLDVEEEVRSPFLGDGMPMTALSPPELFDVMLLLPFSLGC